MKRFFAGVAVLAAVAGILASCGEKEEKSGPPSPTAITTTEQGAQTAKVGATTAQNIIEGTISLSSLAESSPVKLAQQSRAGKALEKTVARLNTKIKKARAMKLANAPQSYSCSGGGTAVIDITETAMTVTNTDCKELGAKETGTWTMSCSNADCTSMTFSVNGTVIEYVQYPGTTGYDYTVEESKSVKNETATLTENSATSFSITMNGSDVWEELAGRPLPRYKEEISFSDWSITGTDNSTTAAENYTVTVNGSASLSEYVDTNGSGFVLLASEADSFGNLTVAWSRNKATSVETFSINGMFSLSVTPDDCAEGTYVFETVVPVTFDPVKGAFTAGELKVNSTVVVKYTAAGGVQVSLDGGATFTTYTDAELAAFCPNL
jgi:hypothetical protein